MGRSGERRPMMGNEKQVPHGTRDRELDLGVESERRMAYPAMVSLWRVPALASPVLLPDTSGWFRRMHARATRQSLIDQHRPQRDAALCLAARRGRRWRRAVAAAG